MSDETVNPEVKAKAQEIAKELANETGIELAHVEKILARLGLEGSIANRLSRISLDNLRISSGGGHI